MACGDEAIGDEDAPLIGIHAPDAHLDFLTWFQACPPGQHGVQTKHFDPWAPSSVADHGRGGVRGPRSTLPRHVAARRGHDPQSSDGIDRGDVSKQ